MGREIQGLEGDSVEPLLTVARRIREADVAANRHMGALGPALFDGEGDVIAHCSTGSPATGGYGTALGVIRSAEAWNPAFDVTPASLIDAIVPEKGVVLTPDTARMAAVLGCPPT